MQGAAAPEASVRAAELERRCDPGGTYAGPGDVTDEYGVRRELTRSRHPDVRQTHPRVLPERCLADVPLWERNRISAEEYCDHRLGATVGQSQTYNAHRRKHRGTTCQGGGLHVMRTEHAYSIGTEGTSVFRPQRRSPPETRAGGQGDSHHLHQQQMDGLTSKGRTYKSLSLGATRSRSARPWRGGTCVQRAPML